MNAPTRGLALVTGGTSGIGFGAAQSLAPDFDLALGYASNEAKADAAREELRSRFPSARIETFAGRLATKADAESLHRRVTETFGRAPSALVNSAGRLSDSLLLQADFDAYRAIVEEHLVATMALCQVALKPMYRAKFGRIVNLSSISASYSKRGQGNYAAAKAGLEAFTRTIALEVAHRGITVNAVAPGLIETPMTRDLIAKIEAGDVDVRARVPAGRCGRPDEVGDLVAFLCSNKAAYITGSVITIDGGRSLGDPQS